MRFHRLFLLILILNTPGCASIVSNHIQSTRVSKINWVKKESHRYCSSSDSFCLDYIYHNTDEVTMRMNYTFVINGVEHVLNLEPKKKSPNQKLVFVLFPGFYAPKESLIPYSMWLRSLGYRVIISQGPNSKSSFDFGLTNAKLMNKLLNNLFDKDSRFVAVGFSMGIIAATELANREDKVIGTIGVAPMQRFDLALMNFEKYFGSKWWYSFISDEDLLDGVDMVLADAGISLSDTDVRGKFLKPTLLLASKADLMAPYSYFALKKKATVTLINLGASNHMISMLFPTEKVRGIIKKWLTIQHMTVHQ